MQYLFFEESASFRLDSAYTYVRLYSSKIISTSVEGNRRDKISYVENGEKKKSMNFFVLPPTLPLTPLRPSFANIVLRKNF